MPILSVLEMDLLASIKLSEGVLSGLIIIPLISIKLTDSKRTPIAVSPYFVSATKTPFQSAGGAVCWKACMRDWYRLNRPVRPKLCSAA
jgi:hypothetical protein